MSGYIFQVKNYYTDNFYVNLGGKPEELGRMKKIDKTDMKFRIEKAAGEED